MKVLAFCLPTVLVFTACLLAANLGHSQWEERASVFKEVEKTFGEPPGMTRLDPKDRVWADKKSKRVVVDGYIALREGQLEMLACLVGTKEHESIVATFCKAQTVHAGLLAVGAQQGSPVKWEPVYTAPTGSQIQVFALWYAEGKKKNIDVRQWVRVVGSETTVLDTNFVFAGSMFWEDPDTGKKLYQAESGDLICVSNFSTSTLDVPIESSKANSGLLFAAFTDRIPPEGTPVRLVLQVVDDKKSANGQPVESSLSQDSKNSSATNNNPVNKLPANLESLAAPPK